MRFIVAVANSLLNPFGFIEYFLSGTAAKKPLGLRVTEASRVFIHLRRLGLEGSCANRTADF